jgi:hypothetical protein
MFSTIFSLAVIVQFNQCIWALISLALPPSHYAEIISDLDTASRLYFSFYYYTDSANTGTKQIAHYTYFLK